MKENMSQDELKKMRRMSYIKMVAMIGIIVAVLAFSSIAWFTMSREVEGSKVQMTGSNLGFEIRVPENSDDSYWDDYAALFNLADSSYKPGEKNTINAVDYYSTNEKYESIKWRLESDDLSTGESILTEGLKPGSSGTLNFDIIPRVSGDLAVDIKLDIRGFVATFPTQAEIDAGMDADTVKALNEVVVSDTSTFSQEEQKAVKYINGHIIYFKEKNTSGNKVVYSGYIENNTYHFQTTTAREGVAIPIHIHWIWVNTIDQLILMSTDSGAKPLVADPVVSNDQAAKDRMNLITHISNHSDYIFDAIDSYDQYNDSEPPQKTYDFSDALDGLNYNSYKSSTQTKSSMDGSYNAADQIIGTNLNYVLIDMKVIESKMKQENN